ncbi:MAG: DUF4080 domain-containing protein [Ruminococcaceae bacterium]|nr:DUF4080 domain-containing protein [Oscillospiraceae bacterium]
MKAVLVAVNSQYIHSSLAPWCLAAGVEKYCRQSVETVVLEGTVNEPPRRLTDKIAEQCPSLVGFSCYIWNIEYVRAMLREVRERTGAVIVLGGPEAGCNARALLESETDVDYILAGEGELPFAMLCDHVAQGKPAGDDIPGLCRRDGSGNVLLLPPHCPTEQPPSPYSQAYFDSLKGRIAYLETGRGCPYRCAFCLSSVCGEWRNFDVNRAKKELLMLASSGTQTVKLVDRTFNADRRRARELFRFISEHYGTDIPEGVCFHFELAGDLLDDETLTVLENMPAGAVQVEIGIQSFNADTLAAVDRVTNVEKVCRAVRRLIACGRVHTHIDLIAGLPLEDMASFRRSFEQAMELRPHMLQLGFLKLLHGAPMREQPERFPCRYSSLPPYEVTSTPWLTADELRHLHAVEKALDRVYNSGRFRRTAEYAARAGGMTMFELYEHIARIFADGRMSGASLDDFTAALQSNLLEIPGVEPELLRDAMVCDRLAASPAAPLPKCLRIEDRRTRAVRFELERDPATRRGFGVKRTVAILYGECCAVWCDAVDRDPVTGQYPLHSFDLDRLGKDE